MDQLWSWGLTAIGLVSLWLIGRRNTHGWLVGIGLQFLWMAYASTTHQWGFLVAAVTTVFIQGKSYREWRKPVEEEA